MHICVYIFMIITIVIIIIIIIIIMVVIILVISTAEDGACPKQGPGPWDGVHQRVRASIHKSLSLSIYIYTPYT